MTSLEFIDKLYYWIKGNRSDLKSYWHYSSLIPSFTIYHPSSAFSLDIILSSLNGKPIFITENVNDNNNLCVSRIYNYSLEELSDHIRRWLV